ncbi:hypothetical protein [Flavobacterium sp. 25HG05S-40]|uniref:hypothetical protein n=1 Tax=Flavobacterium sp. 25HG05S-40 TaxID=3458682 RepID=UPI004044CAB0
MKNCLLLVIFSSFFITCSSGEDSAEADYSSFLSETTPQFNAKINGIQKSWKFGIPFQMGSGVNPMTDDPANSNRYLDFVLNEQSGNRYFFVRTPKYDASSLTEFQQVFGISKKNLGSYIENFFITVKDGDKLYYVCASSLSNKLEIIKTQEFISPETNLPSLKVWFKIDKINSTNCSAGDQFEMKDVKIIAQFISYKDF